MLSVSAVRAEGVDKVLFAGTCLPEGVSANGLAQILAAELSPIQVEPLTRTNPGARTVVLGVDGCTTALSSARISVWNGGERRARVVLLADAAKGTETRTLALALAEAVRNPAVTEPGPPEPLPFIGPPPPVNAVTKPVGVLPTSSFSKSIEISVVGLASRYWLAKFPFDPCSLQPTSPTKVPIKLTTSLMAMRSPSQ